MPCNSDYLAPSAREVELRRTAELYVYVLDQLGKPVPQEVRRASKDIYGKGADCVAGLCGELKALPEGRREQLVYGNPKSRTVRDLADWWEDHQQADAEREAKDG